MKTNRVHRKGGKSKAISQGQTSTPKTISRRKSSPPCPPTDHLFLQWQPGQPDYWICVGADAGREIHDSGLSLTDLEPTLAVLARGMKPGDSQPVDYRALIWDLVRARELAQLAALLGLDREAATALSLLSLWEGQSPVEFARKAVQACMDGAYDEMQGFALGLKGYTARPKEQAWAKEFHGPVQALRPEAGWQV